MKITCSRREDLLKARDAYLAQKRAAEDATNLQWDKYQSAVSSISDPIVHEIESNLAHLSALTFEVRAELRYGGELLEIVVNCNPHQNFNSDVALVWDYTAQVNKRSGQVERKTSSWSGMNAVTPAQMTSLKQSVEALEYLNNIDWDSMLQLTFPSYSDFADPNAPVAPKYRDFNKELAEATVEDIVGQNKAIIFYNPGTESIVWRSKFLAGKILKDSNTQYLVEYTFIPTAWGNNFDEAIPDIIGRFDSGDTFTGRIRKDKFSIVTPEVIIDLH